MKTYFNLMEFKIQILSVTLHNFSRNEKKWQRGKCSSCPYFNLFLQIPDDFTVYSNGIECLYVEALYENPKGIGIVLDLVYGQP